MHDSSTLSPNSRIVASRRNSEALTRSSAAALHTCCWCVSCVRLSRGILAHMQQHQQISCCSVGALAKTKVDYRRRRCKTNNGKQQASWQCRFTFEPRPSHQTPVLQITWHNARPPGIMPHACNTTSSDAMQM